jgi:hypothetical protein
LPPQHTPNRIRQPSKPKCFPSARRERPVTLTHPILTTRDSPCSNTSRLPAPQLNARGILLPTANNTPDLNQITEQAKYQTRSQIAKLNIVGANAMSLFFLLLHFPTDKSELPGKSIHLPLIQRAGNNGPPSLYSHNTRNTQTVIATKHRASFDQP